MDKKIVLAISGSLRTPSFTEKMLDLCLEGMGEGIEVYKFYPHKMNVGPCIGCWSCWDRKKPGICIQNDDFMQILDVYKKADYFLFALPLYVFGFPATVKNVIDRFVVALEPAQIKAPGGGTEHPKRFGRNPKTVLISSCGFPEVENFDILRMHFRKICEAINWSWSGEILIPAAGVSNAPKLFDEKYELIRRAGAQLMSGPISEDLTNRIATPVMSSDDYRMMATASCEGGFAGGIKTVSIAMKALIQQKIKKG